MKKLMFLLVALTGFAVQAECPVRLQGVDISTLQNYFTQPYCERGVLTLQAFAQSYDELVSPYRAHNFLAVSSSHVVSEVTADGKGDSDYKNIFFQDGVPQQLSDRRERTRGRRGQDYMNSGAVTHYNARVAQLISTHGPDSDAVAECRNPVPSDEDMVFHVSANQMRVNTASQALNSGTRCINGVTINGQGFMENLGPFQNASPQRRSRIRGCSVTLNGFSLPGIRAGAQNRCTGTTPVDIRLDELQALSAAGTVIIDGTVN